MYHIIQKVHVTNNQLTYTPIGYVLSEEDANYIREGDKIDTAEQWVADNYMALSSGTVTVNDFISQSDFDHFYVSGLITSSIEGTDLQLITNLDNPEE